MCCTAAFVQFVQQPLVRVLVVKVLKSSILPPHVYEGKPHHAAHPLPARLRWRWLESPSQAIALS
jgi:hypothetical protein